MIGRIYIIRNTINSKVYVGKTLKDINIRFREHIHNAYRKDENGDWLYKYKLYNAVRKHGADKFYIELIDEVDIDILSKTEIEYIAYFNSYEEGYNSTLGGDGVSRDYFDTNTGEFIIDMYESGVSTIQIAKYLGCTQKRVSYFLKKKGIQVINTQAIPVVMLDCNGEVLNEFESVEAARKFLGINFNYNIAANNFHYYVKKAIKTGGIAFGYKWKYK